VFGVDSELAASTQRAIKWLVGKVHAGRAPSHRVRSRTTAALQVRNEKWVRNTYCTQSR